MATTREGKIDVLVILILTVYGGVMLSTIPIMAVAAWIIAALLILRNGFGPVAEYAETNPIKFNLVLLALLAAGYLLSE